jgi:hypothetical protein
MHTALQQDTNVRLQWRGMERGDDEAPRASASTRSRSEAQSCTRLGGSRVHPEMFHSLCIPQTATYAKVLTGASRPTFREAVLQELIAPTSPNSPCRGK